VRRRIASIKALQPLKRRAYATVWMASVVSDIGTWMQLTVLGLLVARESGSALDVGIVMAGQFVPGIIGAPIGGILADRFDRRKTLLWSQSAQTLVTALLAVVIAGGERRAWVIGIFLLLQGLAVTMGNAVSGALQPDLVPREELLASVSLGSASWNAGRVIGPALAFVIERTVGATGAIIGNAISFALLGVAIWSLRRPYPPAGSATGPILKEIAFGARTLWATPGCRAALQGIVPMQLFMAPLMALLPLMATDLGGGQGLTSALSTSQGIGAVLGAAVVPALVARYGRDRTLQLHWVATSVLVFAFGFIGSAHLALIGICLFGGAFTGVLVTWMGLMSRDAPVESRGRVMSIFMGCMGPSYGLSVLFQSVVANNIGRLTTHRLMGLSALATLLLSLLVAGGWVGWKSLRPASRRANPQPVGAAAAG
jgi:MFS family permease